MLLSCQQKIGRGHGPFRFFFSRQFPVPCYQHLVLMYTASRYPASCSKEKAGAAGFPDCIQPNRNPLINHSCGQRCTQTPSHSGSPGVLHSSTAKTAAQQLQNIPLHFHGVLIRVPLCRAARRRHPLKKCPVTNSPAESAGLFSSYGFCTGAVNTSSRPPEYGDPASADAAFPLPLRDARRKSAYRRIQFPSSFWGAG